MSATASRAEPSAFPVDRLLVLVPVDLAHALAHDLVRGLAAYCSAVGGMSTIEKSHHLRREAKHARLTGVRHPSDPE